MRARDEPERRRRSLSLTGVRELMSSKPGWQHAQASGVSRSCVESSWKLERRVRWREAGRVRRLAVEVREGRKLRLELFSSPPFEPKCESTRPGKSRSTRRHGSQPRRHQVSGTRRLATTTSVNASFTPVASFGDRNQGSCAAPPPRYCRRSSGPESPSWCRRLPARVRDAAKLVR